MLYLISILIISYFVLFPFKIKIKTLGLKPTAQRMQDLGIGFIASGILCLIYFSLIVQNFNYEIRINPTYELRNFLLSGWQVLNSVLIEELLFRGALLIIAIKYLGKTKAILLSSVIFGIYHWFSYDVFGNLPAMLNTFITTTVGGLMFAFAYTETRSLYLPVAIHFGWNLVTITVFSEGSMGNQFLISSNGDPMGYWYFIFLLYQILLLPFLTFIYLKKFRRNNTGNEVVIAAD